MAAAEASHAPDVAGVGEMTCTVPSALTAIVARSGGVDATRFCIVSLAGATTASVITLYV